MKYVKRRESHLVTACLNYLQCQENNGKIKWVDRCNSGRIGGVRLHRAGTPDFFFIANSGFTFWLEAKVEGYNENTETVRKQQQFESMINLTPNNLYFIVFSVDDVERIIKKYII